jgi:hypothetical protein
VHIELTGYRRAYRRVSPVLCAARCKPSQTASGPAQKSRVITAASAPSARHRKSFILSKWLVSQSRLVSLFGANEATRPGSSKWNISAFLKVRCVDDLA